MELAFEEYNQKVSEKFKIVSADSKGDAIDAVKQARRLADSSMVMGLIGEVLSGATIAAAGVADVLGVPLLSPTATDDRISTIGPNIFQLNPSLSWQGPAVAQYAVKARGFKTLAMLYPDEGAWESVALAFAKEASKLGAKMVYSQSYTPGTTDFKAQIDQLRLVKVDALFLPASPSDIVMIAPQLAYNQVKLQLLGPESWGDPKVAAQGDVYVEGPSTRAGPRVRSIALTRDDTPIGHCVSTSTKSWKALSWARSIFIFDLLIYLYTAVLGILSLLSSLFDRDGRIQHGFARLYARLILHTIFSPVKVSGLDRIDRSRPHVFAANHISALDIPLLYEHLPFQFRIMAKKGAVALPVHGVAPVLLRADSRGRRHSTNTTTCS